MSEENKRAKCPVCGRFCSQTAVDKYNAMLDERDRLLKEIDGVCAELSEARKSVVEAQTNMGEAIKSSGDYEALYLDTRGKLDKACADISGYRDKLSDAGVKLVSMQSEINELRSENEKIYSRGIWARIINKRV